MLFYSSATFQYRVSDRGKIIDFLTYHQTINEVQVHVNREYAPGVVDHRLAWIRHLEIYLPLHMIFTEGENVLDQLFQDLPADPEQEAADGEVKEMLDGLSSNLYLVLFYLSDTFNTHENVLRTLKLHCREPRWGFSWSGDDLVQGDISCNLAKLSRPLHDMRGLKELSVGFVRRKDESNYVFSEVDDADPSEEHLDHEKSCAIMEKDAREHIGWLKKVLCTQVKHSGQKLYKTFCPFCVP